MRASALNTTGRTRLRQLLRILLPTPQRYGRPPGPHPEPRAVLLATPPRTFTAVPPELLHLLPRFARGPFMPAHPGERYRKKPARKPDTAPRGDGAG